MHVSLARNEMRQNFNIWVHGDDKLVRGSGLFVAETGVSANHHFLMPEDDNEYRFTHGKYTLEVHAKLLGDDTTKCLLSQSLEISREHAIALQEAGVGLTYDWGPDSGRYMPRTDKRPTLTDAHGLLKPNEPEVGQAKGTRTTV